MIETIARLMKGDAGVVQDYVRSKKFWDEFFAQHCNDSQAMLTKAIGFAQSRYEALHGNDRYRGKSMMPWTCFASLYDETAGFEGNSELATRVFRAFQASTVSGEVKSNAKRAADVFGVDE